MTHAHRDFERVVILADKSANWKIGGLRQLDRLILALNEFAEAAGYQHQIAVIIFWEPEIPEAERWLPDNSRLVLVRPIGSMGSLEAGTVSLSTRLFVARNGLRDFLQMAAAMKTEQPSELSTAVWRKLSEQWKNTDLNTKEDHGWRILKQPDDIGPAERQLLCRTGKTQDGFISRCINRPISRFITRQLLRLPITPSTCTLSMLVVPFFAYLFLIRGDYLGLVTGTALFQVANILDGCDGEIARAKYLESERGLRLDAFCDLITNLLFILCLSIGLFRQPSASSEMRAVYLFEGIAAVLLLAGRAASYAIGLVATDSVRQLDRRDGEAVLDSSHRLFGGKITALLVQLTKRDVIFFSFFILAVARLSPWILHITFAFSVITLVLRLKNAALRRRGS